MLFKKNLLRWILMLTIAFSFVMPTSVNAGIKSKCRKTVKKLKRKINAVKNKLKNYKRKLTNVDRRIKKAKRKVNRMPASRKKKKLLRAVLDSVQRAYRLTKYYLKVKNYHLYVAKKVRKAFKPCWPKKWWKRIKKARKVTNRLVKLAKQIPSRLRDINALLRNTNTIIRNASAVTH